MQTMAGMHFLLVGGREHALAILPCSSYRGASVFIQLGLQLSCFGLKRIFMQATCCPKAVQRGRILSSRMLGAAPQRHF